MCTPMFDTEKWTPLTDCERRSFDNNGYVVLREVVPADRCRRIEASVDRHYAAASAQERSGPNGLLHSRGVLADDIEFARLVDHGPVLRWIWGLLGWNIYSHHNHLDVNPPGAPSTTKPKRWSWHQDGWRQNSDPETIPPAEGPVPPRPRFSIKACFVFSDLAEPGRGATLFLPGSHLRNTLPQPADPNDYEHPTGARELRASPGDVLLFDRRLWHSRSRNVSSITRKALFIGYTHRWIRPLDPMTILDGSPLEQALSPLQRQLLGPAPDSADYWGVHDHGGIKDTIPLRQELLRRNLLDRSIPWLRWPVGPRWSDRGAVLPAPGSTCRCAWRDGWPQPAAMATI